MLLSFSPCILLLQNSLSPATWFLLLAKLCIIYYLCFPRIDLFSLFYPTLLDSPISLGWDAAIFTFFAEQPMGTPSWTFEHPVPPVSAQSHHNIEEESCNSSSDKSQRRSLILIINKASKSCIISWKGQSYIYFKGCDSNWQTIGNSGRQMSHQLCLWWPGLGLTYCSPSRYFELLISEFSFFKAFTELYTWETDGLLWNLNNPEELSKPIGGICIPTFKKRHIIYIRDLDGSLGRAWWTM